MSREEQRELIVSDARDRGLFLFLKNFLFWKCDDGFIRRAAQRTIHIMYTSTLSPFNGA